MFREWEGVGSKIVRPTLQKSIDLTPLEPKAGPTGGEGEACPAPTMSLTTRFVVAAAFLDMITVVGLSLQHKVEILRSQLPPRTAL